jgi:sugar phosphate isomerase/epimerase
LRLLGCRFAVAPGIPSELRGFDAVPALSERFNRWGAACRDAGLRFGYHNHGWELEEHNGSTILDALAAATDPTLVDFQIDVYWALVAGTDVPALIARNTGRVPTLHLKELAAGAEPHDTTVGDGITAWPDVLGAARTAGTEWFIVEQEDDPDHAYRDIRRSLANLRALLAAEPKSDRAH